MIARTTGWRFIVTPIRFSHPPQNLLELKPPGE
jgi:hypothetical protein